MPIHLTAHSAYSLQAGLCLPRELAQAAQQNAMPAIGLTDDGLLSGAVEFVQACAEVGVKPLLGLEIALQVGASPPSKLTLLAQDRTGWKNLCQLSTAQAFAAPHHSLSLTELAAASVGLLAFESATNDPHGLRLQALRDIFPASLYVALTDPDRAYPLTRLAQQYQLPSVVRHPLYYLHASQAPLQRVVSAIRHNLPIHHLPDSLCAPAYAHFLSPAELSQRFWHFPTALANTLEVAERIHLQLPLGVPHLPRIPLPAGVSADDALRQQAYAGAMRHYGELTPHITARLEHELGVIARMGFAPVFLIVQEALDFARQQDIPHSSRGSAAGSLVAHCLGITSPDPLSLNLYFERFLNPARSSPPDIDTDLCSRRRDEVIQHVFERYGSERVAMVATVNHYRPRSALADVAKAYGLPPQTARQLASHLPHHYFGERPSATPDQPPFASLAQQFPHYATVFESAQALLKLPRHLSVHPGGVVVAPQSLTELTALMPSGAKGVTITQFDLEAVEALGLVKIDLLGIRGLTVLGDVAGFVQSTRPAEFASPLAVLDSAGESDARVAERIENGQTIGCFQVESPGMRAILREIRARSVDDIMAALALFRPGPLMGGLKSAFVRRFRQLEAVQHLHPALANLLDDTFGVILYQEQVLRLAHQLAGLSLAEADLLRRAMSHFDPGKQMQTLQEKFIRETQARTGMGADTAGRVWEMMAAFAGYGFPKAHAASYARVAWQSAYCKEYFPAEFMAAVLANWGGYYSQRVYLSEARRLGLGIHPPQLQVSRRDFAAIALPGQPKALYMGLDQVKGLTQRTIERILQLRPFYSLEDFLTRADPRPPEALALASVGGLSDFGNIPTVQKIVQSGSWQAGQQRLFGFESEPLPDWSLEQKLNAQQELLGCSVSAHPLELHRKMLEQAGAISLLAASEQQGKRVVVAGIRQTMRKVHLRRGESALALTLEDASGMLAVWVPPLVFARFSRLWGTTQPLLLAGVVAWQAEAGAELEMGPYLIAEMVERVG